MLLIITTVFLVEPLKFSSKRLQANRTPHPSHDCRNSFRESDFTFVLPLHPLGGYSLSRDFFDLQKLMLAKVMPEAASASR